MIVRVRASDDGASARISVEDTGPGIAPDDRARIFEPFERVESEGSESRPGLGLGLALARDVVRTLGGTLELESELGRGSRFTIVLPLVGVDGERGDEHLAGLHA